MVQLYASYDLKVTYLSMSVVVHLLSDGLYISMG